MVKLSELEHAATAHDTNIKTLFAAAASLWRHQSLRNAKLDSSRANERTLRKKLIAAISF
jgi:hypothetical protein